MFLQSREIIQIIGLLLHVHLDIGLTIVTLQMHYPYTEVLRDLGSLTVKLF